MPDVIVIGAGATGGWAAKQLTEAGLDVTVLERGGALELADLSGPSATRRLSFDKQPADDGLRQRVQGRCPVFQDSNRHLFVDDVDQPYSTPSDKPFLWIRNRGVGGRTTLWGAVCLRMSDFELKAASHDGHGEDWPLAYRDLAPYYDEVERFLNVWGSHDNLPQIPDGNCYAARPELTAGELALKVAIERRWPDRKVIRGRGIPLTKTPELTDWPISTAQGSTLAAAARTGRLTLRPSSVVAKILVDRATGRASGVHVIDELTQESFEMSARVIVLCASTIESARLLLNSATPQHPAGLGNSSGVVGHYLMDHFIVRVIGHGGENTVADDRFAVGGPNAIYVPRFRNLRDHHPDFIRGYGTLGVVHRPGLPRLDPSASSGPFVLASLCEALPRFENHVRLDPDVPDKFGIPTVRIECEFGANERAMARDAMEWLKEAADTAGFTVVKAVESLPAPGEAIHEVGTARMGSDPRTSVVDSFNQCWDIENLFVTDGACWVTSGCQNPALTMMAITARACARIVDRLKRLEL